MRALLFLLFFIPGFVLGDYIELRRNANLYPHANRSTQPITKLEHDGSNQQFYELVEEELTNGYFHVRVPGHGDGYIYRTLARLHEGQIPGSTPLNGGVSSQSQVRIGAWNIKKLGHGSRKDYPATALIIEENFDFVAGIEVMQKGGGHPGYDQLLTQLGSGWSGLVTSDPRPNTTAGHAEYYAVFYRANRISQCVGWTGLRFVDDSQDRFSREPSFGCFVATNNGNRFDFLLATYHATWSDGDTDVIADEVSNLTDVFQQMADAQPGEEDMLIIGDFNLVPDDLQLIGFTTQVDGTGSTLNTQGNRTTNLYDHLIVRSDIQTSERAGRLAVLDVREAAVSNRVFHSTISDHLPIVGVFNITNDDD